MKAWGGRFSKKTDKLVEQFTASLPFDKRLYKQDIRQSIAHAAMLARMEIVKLEESDEIIDGLQEIYDEIEKGSFRFDASDEDIHMAIERRLIEKIGTTGGKLHTARSRNDQVATDLRMYVKGEAVEVGRLIVELQEAILKAARENMDVIMPGYTHLQIAQPILFSYYLMARFFLFEGDFRRLKCTYKRSDKMPLGAAALAGTSFPIDRQFLADQLGFASIFENGLDAVSNRDFVADMLETLSLTMVHLSQFAEEVILMSNPHFDFVVLDEAYATGSSIMPQKKNPDAAELIRGKSGRVQGHLSALLVTLKGLPFGYNRDLQEDKEGLFDAIDTVKASLELFGPMLLSMRINPKKMKHAAEQGFAVATDLADYLTQKGVAFRDAHRLTGEIVKFCSQQHKSLKELELKDFKDFSPMFDEDILNFLEVEDSVNRKTSQGGTAPRRVKDQIEEAEKSLTEEVRWLLKKKSF